MSYFSNKTAAFNYFHARPYFHPAVIERIRRECTFIAFFGTVLDLGRGTGQSSAALKDISDKVIGTYISDEMLSQARKRPKVNYAPRQNRHSRRDLPVAPGRSEPLFPEPKMKFNFNGPITYLRKLL